MQTHATYNSEEHVINMVSVTDAGKCCPKVFRDATTGRFVSRKNMARGTRYIPVRSTTQINSAAVTTWINDGTDVHAYSDCTAIRGEVTTSHEDDGWKCEHCVGVEFIPVDFNHRENNTGGLGGEAAATIMAVIREFPGMKVKDVATAANCSVGRVYEVCKAGGARKVRGACFPA